MQPVEICPECGLPTEPITWTADISGIGDDFPDIQVFQDDDELCSCNAVDDE